MFGKKTESVSNYDGGQTELGKFSIEDNLNSKSNFTRTAHKKGSNASVVNLNAAIAEVLIELDTD
jgi:hypothetical protein